MADTFDDIPDPILEAPPADAAPAAASVGTLFGDDSIGLTMAKCAAVESILGLLVRNYKFSEFMREVLLVMAKAVKSEAGSILEVDYKTNSLFFRAVLGQSSDKITKFIIPMGQGIVGYVAESRQPLIVSNAQENKAHLKSIGDAVGFETRNLIAVPLVIRGRVFGVLELLNRVGEADYAPSDLELLRSLCEAASKAIEVRLMIAWAMQAGQARKPGQGEAA